MIRHGMAGDRGSYANDNERPLTNEGIRKTKQIAKRLYELDLRFELILTSPLVRAQQTAEILKTVGLGKQLEESAYLAPAGAFDGWLDWLKQWQANGAKRLAIVGHEPDLSEWAERLVWGEAQQHLRLKKAGVIGLTLPQQESPIGSSQLFLLAPPKFLV